jgi:hypothetical protein
MDLLNNFIQRLYQGNATEQDITQAKRLTMARDDPKCTCGHKAFRHSWNGTREPSGCHVYGCNCTSFTRA